MSQQSTFNTLKPVYNLVELGLDDYEENELVLNAIHDLYIYFQNSSNCTCRRTPKQRDLRTCFEKVGFKCFFERHFELKALEEHELFIKSQLISLSLCKPAYLKLCGVNDYLLSTLQNHLQSNGLTEHVHGNTGHASKTESRVFLDFNITFTIKQFLVQYGAIHGFPSPLWHQDDSEKVVSYFTFRRLWYEMIPSLRFQPYASDLCEVCSSFKAKLLVAKQDIDEYNKVQVEYDEHRVAVDLERETL
ncbi:chaperonin: PROVISIONAL [Gigaspora margarita]|uniref:Chaperonin: PROVISIONAL n=1 Tax=Gigaspora margarita TaxID=4874 RepID=A0A8H4AGZ1_GIGMA|nr:chaperonin: PROVISIONAL [Gigaspora margarita]